MGYGQKRFSIFDLMESKGYFKQNPANKDAVTEHGTPLYRGPQKYPKMMYHPTGEENVVVPSRKEMTPFGVQETRAVTEVKYTIVYNRGDEEAALSDGWHFHPADALKAGGKPYPARTSDVRVVDLEEELALKNRELAELRAMLGDRTDTAVPGRLPPVERRHTQAYAAEYENRPQDPAVGSGELDFSQLAATPASAGQQAPLGTISDAIAAVTGKKGKNLFGGTD